MARDRRNKTAESGVRRFRVVRGVHQEKGVTYKKGDIVQTTNDLNKHNHGGGIKFEEIK